jgi:predicted ester cyclase
MEAKSLVRKFWESYNDGDLDRSFETYIDPNLAQHAFGGAFNREAWRNFDKQLFTAFTGARIEIFDQIAEGDMVATRYAFTATQADVFQGIPSHGATATLSATSFDRVAGGKIVEHWTDMDYNGFLQQLSESPAT